MRTNINNSSNISIASLLRLPDQDKFEIAQQLLVSIKISSFKQEEKKSKHRELIFPKMPKDLKPSQEVLDMVVGKLPADFDYDKAIDEIITRDEKGFSDCQIPVFTPSNFLAQTQR